MPANYHAAVCAGKRKKRPRKPPIHLRRKAVWDRGDQPPVAPIDFGVLVEACPPRKVATHARQRRLIVPTLSPEQEQMLGQFITSITPIRA